MTKREHFGTVMTVLAETFNRPLTKGSLEGYWRALGGLSDAQMAGACDRALESCKFMPAPSELLAFARPARSLVVEAAAAWDAVRRAVDRVDWTVSQIDFGPHVNAVVRQLGGWDALCRANLTDLDVWKRKEFERLYVEFADKQIGDMGHALEGPKEGKPYAAVTIGITGIPSQPVPALEPIGANGVNSAEVRKLVKDLADEKELT